MAKETRAQQKTVERVMHEFKTGELESGPDGKAGKVKNPRQALAIALREAGVPPKGQASSGSGEQSRTELYAEAKRRDIAGRSRMTKDQLAKALAD